MPPYESVERSGTKVKRTGNQVKSICRDCTNCQTVTGEHKSERIEEGGEKTTTTHYHRSADYCMAFKRFVREVLYFLPGRETHSSPDVEMVRCPFFKTSEKSNA